LAVSVQLHQPLPPPLWYIYWDFFLQNITCGFLATYQYALLTSARSIINPRFHLTTPLVSGLFHIASGTGFLVGSILSGYLSHRRVQKHIILRNGVRLPPDRLNMVCCRCSLCFRSRLWCTNGHRRKRWEVWLCRLLRLLLEGWAWWGVLMGWTLTLLVNTAGKSSLTPRRLKDGGDMLMRREPKRFFPIRDQKS
jgi:hypothetical protein